MMKKDERQSVVIDFVPMIDLQYQRTTLEASPAIKCKGCGKRINECSESMFGTFALEQCKNYVNRKGVVASMI